MNNIRFGTNRLGRKLNAPEEFELVALDYMFGFITREECGEKLKICEASDLKRRKWFKNVMKGAGVTNFHNEINYQSWIKGDAIGVGDECGWVEINGQKKKVYYKMGLKR